MRVVAGSAGGIRIASPRPETRPTMDKVKAAIFSSLGDFIQGARVLDLFAGSGGLGIEALSRGCAMATFVDDDARAVETVKTNLIHAKLEGLVVRADVFSFLARQGREFDLVMADPPYARIAGSRDYAAELMSDAFLPRCIREGGMFILERLWKKEPPGAAAWDVVKSRKYGETEVLFLRCAAL